MVQCYVRIRVYNLSYPGKKNIVPDVLSQASLPIPMDTMNNFVLPHIKITAFIAANMLSYDIPHICLENTKLQSDFALFCLHSVGNFTSDPKSQTIFPHLLSTNILFPASTKIPNQNMSTP